VSQLLPSRSRLPVAVGIAALVMMLAAGSVVMLRDDGPRLVSRTNGSAAATVTAPGSDRYYAVAVGQVCVSEESTARIRSVEPVDPQGGIKVTDFVVMAADDDILGAFDGRLRDKPGFDGSGDVSDVCIRGKGASDLYLEVLKPRAEDAWADEYRLDYTIAGDTRSARIRFAFGVCEREMDLCDVFEHGWG
jgi:hypothetical protein